MDSWIKFLAEFSPLYISSTVGYPNHVPDFHEWHTIFPKFSGYTHKRSNQHLKYFHECMEQLVFCLLKDFHEYMEQLVLFLKM